VSIARRLLVPALSVLALALPRGAVAQQAPKPTPQEAQALLKDRPDLLAQLRQRIMTSGMTPDQVRARLRAEGYPENLLDAYLPGATGTGDAVPTNDVFDAIRALGISDSTDVDSLRTLVGPAREKAAQPAVPFNATNDPYATNPYLTKAQREREDSLSRLESAAGRSRVDIPIFGTSLFRSSKSEFQPNLDGPVDANYRLGPGDRLVLILTGEVETAQTLDVTREGFVLIPQVGQIAVANLTIAQLEEVLFSRLGRVYSGVKKGAGATTHFQVSVAKLRSNQIFVVGDVVRPGSYRVSSAGTVMTALYAAGGPSDNGTLRSVTVRRGGKEVGRLDVYDYLLRGDASRDLRLESGDIVFVATHGPRVRISGEITRSAIYELKAGETLNDLVAAAGGLTASASRQRIQIERVIPLSQRGSKSEERTLIEVTSDAALGSATPSLPLENGDYVRVFGVAERVRNRLTVKGNVWRSGAQAFAPGITLSEVLRRAGGTKPDTYLGQVLVSRLKGDSTRVQLRAMLRDTTGAVLGSDLALADDDEITVFSLTDFRPKLYVAVAGAVRKPGQIPYREGMTLRDALLLVGGATEKAYTNEVEVARFPLDRHVGQLATTTRVPFDSAAMPGSAGDVGNGTSQGAGTDFVLRPYDNILVMQRTDWRPLQSVWVTGEVRYPGKYVIRDKTERVRDLILRAGGLLAGASIEASYLARARSATTFASAIEKNSAAVRLGVDLSSIMNDPSDLNNLLVEAGDSLDIPTAKATIEVRGAVNLPTVTVVKPGAGLNSYLRAAGGASQLGDPSRAYVIQPSGKIEARRSLWFFSLDPTPRPGATVIVPPRDTSNTGAAALATITTITQIIAGLLTAYALIKR